MLFVEAMRINQQIYIVHECEYTRVYQTFKILNSICNVQMGIYSIRKGMHV